MDLVTVRAAHGEVTGAIRDVEPTCMMIALTEELEANPGDALEVVWSADQEVIRGTVTFRSANSVLIALDTPLDDRRVEQLAPTMDVTRPSGTVDLAEITDDFEPRPK